MKYLYCLTRDVCSIRRFPPGISGARVCRIAFRGLIALVSDIHPDSLAGTVEQAVAHGEIVNRAWQSEGAVIPCRFGTLFATQADVLSLLKEHYASIQADLNKLAGKVEVGVKAIFDMGLTVTSSRKIKTVKLAEGERYLLEKREQYRADRQRRQKAEQFSRALHQATAFFWVEMRTEKQRTDKGLVLSFCYLLKRDELFGFKRALSRLRKSWPGLKVMFTGPWPPYSFSQIDLTRCEY